MEVRAKKSLGQHFLTDLSIAQRIVESLRTEGLTPVLEGDFLKLRMDTLYGGNPFCVIGNFPYNIPSQIFFRILDYREQIPQVVCMIQNISSGG